MSRDWEGERIYVVLGGGVTAREVKGCRVIVDFFYFYFFIFKDVELWA